MNVKRTIGIGGVFYGCHNIGDEAILESMILAFNNKCKLVIKSFGSD